MARSKFEYVNDRGDTALSLAISLRVVDSIRLLVNSGAKLGRTYLEHGKMRFFSQGSNSDTITKKIICILVRVFAQRRKELLSFALRHLPMNHITSLQLQDKKILDHEAQWVLKLLKLYNIHFPSYLGDSESDLSNEFNGVGVNECIHHVIRRINEDRGDSVYHFGNIEPFIAQKFWDERFRRIVKDRWSYTPLMTISFDYLSFVGLKYLNLLVYRLDMIAWFEEHGENIHSWHRFSNDESGPQFATIHQLVHMLGRCLYFPSEITLSQHNKGYLENLLSDRIEDACTCLCSEGGCTPASIFIRTSLGCHPMFIKEYMTDYIVDLPERPTLDIIRVITFEDLGIKHTCCNFDGRKVEPMDIDEAKEIRAEDRYLAVQLNGLMAEFTSQLQDTHLPLARFITENWEPRMELWRNERDEITEEDRQEFQEIGVWLQEP